MIFGILLFNNQGYSQNQPDLCQWSEFTLEKKLSKKLSLEFEEEVRFDQNISRFDLLHSSIGLNYRLIKELRFAFAYRFTGDYTINDKFSYRHRLSFDALYRYGLQNLTFTYRSRIQSEIKNYYSSPNGKYPAWVWRNKLTAKYSFKKTSPFIGAELFYQIYNTRNIDQNLSWPKQRAFVGFDYKINKRNEVGASFKLQRGVDDIDPKEYNVIGFSYTYIFSNKK